MSTTPSTGGFGKPKYTTGPAWKNFKLEDGKSLIARILPPMKSLAEEGKWEVFQKQHFGYNGKGTEPGKTKPRPFGCPEDKDFRTGMVRTSCCGCDVRESQQQLLNGAVADIRADFKKQHPELQDKALETAVDVVIENEKKSGSLKPLVDWLKQHNCDRKWVMNVMDANGDFGPLRISNDTNKVLKAKIKEAMDAGIDPLDLQSGLFFKFSRTGKQLDAKDSIEIYSETTKDPKTNRVTQEWKLAPLSEEQIAKALEVCPDLPSLITWLTTAQMEAIVNGNGDPAEIDAIFAMSQKVEKTEKASEKTESKSDSTPEPPVEKPTTKVNIPTEFKASASSAAGAPVSEPPSSSAPVATMPNGDPNTLSEEEFLQKYS